VSADELRVTESFEIARRGGGRQAASIPAAVSSVDVPPGSVALPLSRSARPPRLLLTLLGDYWWQRNESLPSAALVSLLGEFAIGDAAARAALSRLVHNGLLVRSKLGRQTFHGLTERTDQILDDGARRLFSFGLEQPPWDGQWSAIAFSIPEQDRRLRHTLRDRLRWLGFAPLYDGLWVSPRDSLGDAVELLAELSVTTATAFRAQTIDGTPNDGLPQRAWDLTALREQYERFIAELEPLQQSLADLGMAPEQALIARTRAMDSWRAFRALDPELPALVLPANWPQARARQLFVDTYDALGPAAEQRVRSIIARHAPELARLATHHRVDATLAALGRSGRRRRRPA
jgi:phenylacetic acid degradation operon negative regulatory protein